MNLAPETAAVRDASAAAVAVVTAAVLGSAPSSAHFDPALSGYFAALVVAVFATVRRVSLFWRRPPTAFYGRALVAALRRPRSFLATARNGARDLAAQRFLFRRGRMRGLAHLLLSWGTLVGFGVTLPLVFGWLRFEADGLRFYRALFVSVPVARFDADGLFGWLVFHALHLSAVAVIAGASYFLALRVRLRREGAAGTFHRMPLLLLLAVAATGLLLPLAAAARTPWSFRAAQLVHEAAVVMLLVALPHGKLLHVFIRPLQLGAWLVRERSERASCPSCGATFAPSAQLEAVGALLGARGFRFGGHQNQCPPCRRRCVSAAQARLLDMEFQPRPAAPCRRLRRAA